MKLANRGARQRGFTLIELMFTLAVSTIVIGIITRVVFVQQRSFMDQISYSETQQNARASISLLKLYVRKAGWGMQADINAQGEVPLGACFDDADPTIQMLACDRADLDAEGAKDHPNGSDRLRVVSIDPNNGGFVLTPAYSPIGTLQIGVRVDPDDSSAVPASTYTNAGQPLLANDLALVSGPCDGGGLGADLVEIQSIGSNASVYYEYAYLNLLGTGSALTCATGYTSEFGIGRANVVDFWIDRTTDPDHPILRMRADPRQPLSDAFVVAWDIDDLQVQYLLDTTCEPAGSPECPLVNTPDFVWDEVCDDLTPGVDDTKGGCDTSANAHLQGLTHRQRLSRVVGARVAIVARTRNYRTVLDAFDDSSATIPSGMAGAALTVQNHTYAGRKDGYRRWIYRATVALRNNEL